MENSGRHRSNRYLIIWICILAVAAPLAAQTSRPAARPSLPRTPDGHPELQGSYDLATLPPPERPAGAKAVLTAEEAAKFEKGVAAQREAAGRPITGERSAPPKGGDGSTGPAGGVGGYNNFWLDPGSSFTIVNGERRTSLIVDPPDGRVPTLTAAARQRAVAARVARPTSDATESRDPGLEPPIIPCFMDLPLTTARLGRRCGAVSSACPQPSRFYTDSPATNPITRWK